MRAAVGVCPGNVEPERYVGAYRRVRLIGVIDVIDRHGERREQIWYGDRGKNADDHNDDEKFDKREAFLIFHFSRKSDEMRTFRSSGN